MKWFTAMTIIMLSFAVNATNLEDESGPYVKKILVEREIKISPNLFVEGEDICKMYGGLKYIVVNSVHGTYSYLCSKRGMKITFTEK